MTTQSLSTLIKVVDNDEKVDLKTVSPLSKELVIGLIGYAGSGCSSVAKRLKTELHSKGYHEPRRIRLSELIVKRCNGENIPAVVEGSEAEGIQKLARAKKLQDLGDGLREKYENHAVASLAIREIIRLRSGNQAGEEKIAFIIDSLKHPKEVELLRSVYDKSFRLVAVHCERAKREGRLIGDPHSLAKYKGADPSDVREYLDRDEKDQHNTHGQQVRDAFHHADYFLDNNIESPSAVRVVGDLGRFVSLILANDLVRPTKQETGMFFAQAAALRSSCLSRQVGAALQSPDGTIIATGTNDVPAFNGGVCDETKGAQNRCFAWEWEEGNTKFKGCHNSRLKNKLREDIAKWLVEKFSTRLADMVFPAKPGLMDTENALRDRLQEVFAKLFLDSPENFDRMPGIKDIIEYSRSIHAEMNALFSAATQGISPRGCTLYTSTFPCHNCARHLVTAGIKEVYYIEPFTKSLATHLHSDSLTTEREVGGENKMRILPFTGVGPRLYEEYFLKRVDLKNDRTGEYNEPKGDVPNIAVRLSELADVEKRAAELVSD
ncbi:MAG TPA: anti-phage dCTP deaminase [Azospirillaceae bacterium]|nr:anti-phage dCTP deaminase [Azospirillaceae bacterium]